MEAPLALHGDAEAEQPAEPQPLPRELRENLRRLVLLGTVGPLAPATREAQRRRAQAVAGSVSAFWWLAPFVVFRAIPDEALLVRWACVALFPARWGTPARAASAPRQLMIGSRTWFAMCALALAE